MFGLLKYGGNPLKIKFRVTLTGLVSGVTVQNVQNTTRATIDILAPAAENEDQNHNCPRREMNDGIVSSLAWMMPR